ncbi:MAG: hypothetical protein CR964_01385 [Rhodobacterales bacterium]|nr:MAG: hypothetical protein CR964_01385 [Rhodobacterales bacterium]
MSRNGTYLIALSILWGASFMTITLALEGFGPISLAAIRIAIGALLLTGLLHAMGARLPGRRQTRLRLHAAGMGLFSNAIPFFCCPGGNNMSPAALPGSPWPWAPCGCCRRRMSSSPTSR